VFPAKLPSSSISASGGVDEISSAADSWPVTAVAGGPVLPCAFG